MFGIAKNLSLRHKQAHKSLLQEQTIPFSQISRRRLIVSGIVPYLAHLKSCEIHLLTRLRIAPYLSISHDTMRLGARDESPHKSPHLHTSPQNTNSLSPHSTRSHVAGGTREISPYLPTFSHTPPYLDFPRYAVLCHNAPFTNPSPALCRDRRSLLYPSSFSIAPVLPRCTAPPAHSPTQ